MYHPHPGVHGPPERRPARPQFERARGGRSRRGVNHDPYGFDPRGSGFVSHTPSGPRFSFRRDRFPPMRQGLLGVFPTFPGPMTQHWYSPQFTNPSVVPFAHCWYLLNAHKKIYMRIRLILSKCIRKRTDIKLK